ARRLARARAAEAGGPAHGAHRERLAPGARRQTVGAPLAAPRVDHRHLVRDRERVPGAPARIEAQRVGVEAILLQENLELLRPRVEAGDLVAEAERDPDAAVGRHL